MNEPQQRSEVISTRLTPAELDTLRQHAGGKGLSTYLRECALAAAKPPDTEPHVRVRRGRSWVLEYAPGRVISIRRAPGYRSDGVGVWTAADARDLAVALLQAAAVAELPDQLETATIEDEK